MNKKIAIYYHRVDWDGIISALVVKKFLEKKGHKVEMCGWTYGDDIPGTTEILEKFSSIYIVDISFPPSIMIPLSESSRVIWIDHHQTAIQDSIDNSYIKMPGLRRNGTAACELTWEYLYPKIECPYFIQLVGTHDTWQKDRYSWDTEVLPLQYGLKSEYGLGLKGPEEDWDDLLDPASELLDYLISIGGGILGWLRKSAKSWVSNCGIPVTVAGKYKGIVLFSPMGGSLCFESVLDTYDIYIVAQIRNSKDGENKYSISMYKEPDRIPEFSCGDYLKSLNPDAGGHKAAAGSNNFDKERFERLLFYHII